MIFLPVLIKDISKNFAKENKRNGLNESNIVYCAEADMSVPVIISAVQYVFVFENSIGLLRQADAIFCFINNRQLWQMP